MTVMCLTVIFLTHFLVTPTLCQLLFHIFHHKVDYNSLTVRGGLKEMQMFCLLSVDNSVFSANKTIYK